jgi:hypothetical protein
MELDENGDKQWGTLWFSASCANAVAVDNGIIYVAGEKGWIGNKLKIHRLSEETHKFIPNPKGWHNVKRTDAAFVDDVSTNFSGICGMVITPNYIVLSLSDKNRLALFDKKSAEFVKEIFIPEIAGICKGADDSVFAISGKTVVNMDLSSGVIKLVVASDLQQPSRVAIDANGNFYVSDSSKSEQCVKVFSNDGSFLRTVGKKGGRHEGLYDSKAMGNPEGVAIDSVGQLWVAENYFFPKRISVWNREGELLKEFVGSPEYGGGGSLDPQNSDVAFYNGMIFDLKPWPEQATLKAVSFLPEDHKDLPIDPHKVPMYAIRKDNILYFVSSPMWGAPNVVYELKDNHLKPCVALGTVREIKKQWKQTPFVDQLIKDKVADNLSFLWSDNNGDGKASPSEILFLDEFDCVRPIWSSRIGEQLQLQIVVRKNKEYKVISFPAKIENGRLEYSVETAVETPLLKNVYALASDPAGNYIVNFGGVQGDKNNMLTGLDQDGETMWTYPNPYPGNWHNSPRPSVGDIQHTLNIEGFADVKGFDTPVFQLNGNKGVRYLFTTDGLFICQLFGDMRTTPLMSKATKVEVGMRLDKYSLLDECFSGWFGNSSDGRILQIEGKDSCNVMQVRGLESLQRIKGKKIRLSKAVEVVGEADNQPNIKMIFNPVFGVKPHEYKYKFPAKNPIAKFAMSYTSHNLTLQMTVNDESPFINAGQDFKTLFKTGDCIDIRLGIDNTLPVNRKLPGVGDMRIVIADMNGKPTAVLYEFVVTGIADAEKSKFVSPVGMYVVDEIKVLEKVRVNIKKGTKSYSAKIIIPWKELGLSEVPDGIIKGDVGVIMSDSAGTRNVARYYYYDQNSQVVSDLPSEAKVDPSQWGNLEF